MKSLAKNSIYNIIYQTISLVFPLITSVYISRILLEDGVGKVAYAQNVASYFCPLLRLAFLHMESEKLRRFGTIK